VRPVFALLVAVIILGGLQLYMTIRPQPSGRMAAQDELAARGRFSVEITLTFDAGPDAFSLDVSDAPAVLVQLRGVDLLRRQEEVLAGDQVVIDDVSGLVEGKNEFFVQATPSEVAHVARAVRVRVLRDGIPLADETLWAEPSEIVRGAVVVEVPTWAGAQTLDNRVPASAAESSRE
jgi:hypothetical protein